MPPSWRPVPACIRNGHSAGGKFINAATTAAGGTILICGDDKAAGGQFFPATTQNRRRDVLPNVNDKAAGVPFNTETTGFRRRNYSSLRQRKFESDTASLRLRLLQASYSTCRNDGTAVILDFRPRIGNRCSYEDHFGDFRTAILDLRGSIWQSLQLRGSFRGLPCSDS